MAADTVRAAAACPAVAAVVVVTDDPAAARALGALGARVVADEPDAGLNPALAHGAAVAAASWPDRGTAALAADLPALRPAELARGLRAAARWPEAFVADAEAAAQRCTRPGPGRRSGHGSGRDRRPGTGRAGPPRSCWPMCPASGRTWTPRPTCTMRISLGVGPRTAELAAQLS